MCVYIYIYIYISGQDTVDDKVGAALSMVYVTGQPIVFVRPASFICLITSAFVRTGPIPSIENQK